MKALLITTALLEGATGLALSLSPALPVSLLLGAALDTPGGLTVARIAGAAVLSLGVACCLARHDGESQAGRSVVAAMLVYNVAVVVILLYARLGPGLSAVGLWPAVGLHTAMAGWCVACLRRASASTTEPSRF